MRNDMTLRSLVPTLVVSAVVAWCGAVGASYVLGRGEAAFGPLVIAVITLVGTVFFACLAIWVMLAYQSFVAKEQAPSLYEENMHKRATDTSRAGARHKWRGLRPLSKHSAGAGPRATKSGFDEISFRLARLVPRWNRRSIALFCGIMAVCWLPWLIANYPGGAYWDTFYQIHQCFPENHPISIVPFGDHAKDTLTDAYFCDHHPLFDTLIYGAFAAASQTLTGAWNLGTFAFVILQGAATIVALTASVAYLRKLDAPHALCFAAFAYFCVMPFVSTWALTMVKDSLFSLVYLPYFMMLLAAVVTRGESLRKPRAIVLFIVLGVLLCLTKKTGIYVVVPTALITFIVLAIATRSNVSRGDSSGAGRLAIAFGGQVLACLLVIQVLLPAAVFPLLNVAPGGAQESLGLPLQQTAAFVHAHHDEVTPDERAAIDAIIPYHKVEEEYDPLCHDAVKYWYRQDSPPEEVQAYLSAWAAMGLRHPETYLAATFAVAGSYLAPCQSLNIRTTTCDTWQNEAHVLYNPESLTWLREGMANLFNGFAETPVVCLPVQAVVWVFWIPALLLLVTWRFRPRELTLFVPGAIVLAFCVIGPIFDARYCLPLLYTVPLLACFVFRKPLQREAGSPVAQSETRSGREAVLLGNGRTDLALHPGSDRKEDHDDRNAPGGHHHGIDIGHGRHAAVHGPAGCVRRAVRGESGQRAPHA